jgi:N-acetylmuramoyl-L-alanine amidase
MVAAALLSATSAQAAQIASWRFDANQNTLEFTTDNGVQPQAQLIANPTRLVIDLPGIAPGRSGTIQTYNGAVRAVRVGQFQQGMARMVVELAPGYTIDPARVKFRGITAQQWVVQLPQPQPLPGVTPPPLASLPPYSPPFATRPPSSFGNAPVVIGGNPTFNAPVYNPIRSATGGAVVVPGTGISGTGMVNPPWQASAPAIPPTHPSNFPPNNPTIPPSPVLQPPMPQVPMGALTVIIDPGHGGPDPGAVGIGGIHEKEIVLDISQRLMSVLQQQGIRAIITRSDDRDLDLQPRVDMAEQTNATVFVSIHANAISASRPDVNGIETYYYNTGETLARTIHDSVVQATGARDRGVKSARFYVLRNTTMPSVLVEVGFVTGREDAVRLSNSGYRSQMADAIARGIVQYLQRTAQR